MIESVKDFLFYIDKDIVASEVSKKKIIMSYIIGGCEINKLTITLRIMEYCYNTNKKILYLISKNFSEDKN